MGYDDFVRNYDVLVLLLPQPRVPDKSSVPELQVRPTILILTPFESSLGEATKKSCTIFTSSTVVSKSSRSNSRTIAPRARYISAYARLHCQQRTKKRKSNELYPYTLSATPSKVHQIFLFQCKIKSPSHSNPSLGSKLMWVRKNC